MWKMKAEQKFQLLNNLFLSFHIFPSQLCNFTFSTEAKLIFIHSLYEFQQNTGNSALGREKSRAKFSCFLSTLEYKALLSLQGLLCL